MMAGEDHMPREGEHVHEHEREKGEYPSSGCCCGIPGGVNAKDPLLLYSALCVLAFDQGSEGLWKLGTVSCSEATLYIHW